MCLCYNFIAVYYSYSPEQLKTIVPVPAWCTNHDSSHICSNCWLYSKSATFAYPRPALIQSYYKIHYEKLTQHHMPRKHTLLLNIYLETTYAKPLDFFHNLFSSNFFFSLFSIFLCSPGILSHSGLKWTKRLRTVIRSETD